MARATLNLFDSGHGRMSTAIDPPTVAKPETLMRMAQLRTATITDTQSYGPVRKLKASSKARPPRKALKAVPVSLRDAVAGAQAYSESKGGAGLIILVDGSVAHEAYRDGLDGDTLFASQSLHKSLLALVVGTALKDGIIPSLDIPLSQFLEEWGQDTRGRITLRQAMQMHSGLVLYSMATGSAEALELSYGQEISRAAMMSPAVEAPGSAFVYNNANAQLIGLVLSRAIKRATNEDYAAYLERRIWHPLGNGSAEVWLDKENGDPHYFAGLHASLRDWAEIGEWLRTGRLGDQAPVDDQFLAEMMAPSATNPNYGLLLWLGAPDDGKRVYSLANPFFVPHSAPYNVDDMVFFDGFGGQRVYVSRKARLVIARFGETSFDYDDAIIPNLILESLGL